MSVRIRLIGPLAVEHDGGELNGSALGGVRERRLLAILALAGGEVVPKDVLVERLWDRQPQHPLAAIDTAVSLTRRALGPAAAVLETARPGYRLRCPTDLGDLDALVAERRWDEAVAMLKGELLGSDPASEWVEGQRRDFTRRRIEILLEAAGAAATNGDDSLASERFAAALAEDTMREDGYRGQMACLARLGRPAEALRVYERCRRVLREELGADPSDQTRALYEQILAGGNRPAPAGRVAHPRLCPSSAGAWSWPASRRPPTTARCASFSANPVLARAACSRRPSPPWTARKSARQSASGWCPPCRMPSSRTWRPTCSRARSHRGARPRRTWPAWPPRGRTRCRRARLSS